MWRGGFTSVCYSITFFKHPQKLSVWSWFGGKIPYIPPHFLMVSLILNPTQLLNTSGLLTFTENLICLYNFVFPLISLSVEDLLIIFYVFSLIYFLFSKSVLADLSLDLVYLVGDYWAPIMCWLCYPLRALLCLISIPYRKQPRLYSFLLSICNMLSISSSRWKIYWLKLYRTWSWEEKSIHWMIIRVLGKWEH